MDINHFGPFDPDVWGSVSDYISVFVYATTAVLLYMTLQSQLAVQRLQQRHFDFERFNHRQNILPKFILRLKYTTRDHLGAKLIINAVVTLTLNNYPAKNFTLTTTVAKPAKLVKQTELPDFEFLNSESDLELHLLIQGDTQRDELDYSNNENPFYYIDAEVLLLLNYSDNDGNEYEQSCHLSYSKLGPSIRSDSPIYLGS